MAVQAVELSAGRAQPTTKAAASVVLVHDYLTQAGGAERVALEMARAFPDAPIITSLYEPSLTFPDFSGYTIRPSPLNRFSLLRRNHRLAFPFLASSFSQREVHADVVLCSSSGWAHGIHSDSPKVVYCHNPARWLYQRQQYLGSLYRPVGLALLPAWPVLERWDRRAASGATRYLVNSELVRRRVRCAYGLDAQVLHPPPALSPEGPQEPIEDLEEGFMLCVGRLLCYKNVDAVVSAFDQLPGQVLVVAGDGPHRAQIARLAGPGVRLVGRVTDAQLRWMYAHCSGLVLASYEDFGLVPLEAASFGKPAAVLRFGGFLETVIEGETGVLFDEPRPDLIAQAVRELCRSDFSACRIVAHADRFSPNRFAEELHAVVDEVAA